MKKTIALKIDVTKIEKERLFKGKKGTYLDAVLMFDTDDDQYGNNGMIVQSVSKDEREAGTKGNILGNAKDLSKTTKTVEVDDSFDDMDDDLPF